MFMGLGHPGRQMLAAKAGPSVSLDFTSGVLDPRITFTRSGGASYFDNTGTLQQAASGAPRFDYDPVALTPRGLLIEEQRTNSFTQSGDFSNAAWAKSSCTLSAAVQAPDGTNTARGLISNSGIIGFLGQPFVSVAATTYCISVFAKAAGSTSVTILVPGAWWADATNRSAIFNLTGSGSLGTVSGGTAAAFITQLANGWYRCALVVTPDQAASTTIQAVRASANGDGVTTQVIVWGAQLEVGAFPTSYIPTLASAVGRNADVANIQSASFINQSVGTLLFEYMLPYAVNGAASQYVGDLSDNSTNNRYALRAQTTGNQLATMLVISASVAVTSGTLFTNTPLVKQKIAMAYQPSGQIGSGRGGSVQSLAATVPVVSLVTMGIGSTGAGTNGLDGWITHAAYWPRAMGAAELQNATV
jgi:hypothetical protein